MLINSDGLPWLESHFNAGPAAFWPSKWTDKIGDAMFLVPVSRVWCAQLGHKFLVTRRAENLGRVASTLLSAELRCLITVRWQSTVLLTVRRILWSDGSRSSLARCSLRGPTSRLYAPTLSPCFGNVDLLIICIYTPPRYSFQGSYRSGRTGKSQGIWVARERSGENIFFGKVRENEKLVPPGGRFSGQKASNWISDGAAPQTRLGQFTALPNTP